MIDTYPDLDSVLDRMVDSIESSLRQLTLAASVLVLASLVMLMAWQDRAIVTHSGHICRDRCAAGFEDLHVGVAPRRNVLAHANGLSIGIDDGERASVTAHRAHIIRLCLVRTADSLICSCCCSVIICSILLTRFVQHVEFGAIFVGATCSHGLAVGSFAAYRSSHACVGEVVACQHRLCLVVFEHFN